MRRRPEAKAVLLALADRAENDGSNAWPSVATIADETEMSGRTVDKCLAGLRGAGIITEQAPPRQHRPRTWRIEIPALLALLPSKPEPQDVAGLSQLGSHAVTSLNQPAEVSAERPDPQLLQSEAQLQSPDPQVEHSGSQPVADDPVLLIQKENCPLNDTPAFAFSKKDEEENYKALKGIALRVLENNPQIDFNAHVAAVREEAELYGIRSERASVAVTFTRAPAQLQRAARRRSAVAV